MEDIFVYVESTKSLAFQFIRFEDYNRANNFVKNINSGENTLNARVVDNFYSRDFDF